MYLKALFLTAAMATVPAAAWAEACSNTAFRDKGLKLAREAYPQLVARNAEWTFTREELAARRDKERTCAGQEALDYLLLLSDVQKAELPEAVAAMGKLLRAESPALEKKRMMDQLIERFVMANEITTSIELLRKAMVNFPDHAGGYESSLVLLLTGRGKFDEARAIADAKLDASLEDPPANRIPYAGWLRLAVSEVSGDKADEAAIIARLGTRYGDETEALIARDLPISHFAMLLKRAFGPASYVEPIMPPRPKYPYAMRMAYKSGLCEVRFDITEEGVPENVRAECTEDGFVEESERAISEVRFKPVVIDGVAFRTYNVVYPMEYNIQ
jgi:hypothetical protein